MTAEVKALGGDVSNAVKEFFDVVLGKRFVFEMSDTPPVAHKRNHLFVRNIRIFRGCKLAFVHAGVNHSVNGTYGHAMSAVVARVVFAQIGFTLIVELNVVGPARLVAQSTLRAFIVVKYQVHN